VPAVIRAFDDESPYLVDAVTAVALAVFRARVLPWWVGVLFIVAPLVGSAGIPGGAGLIADYSLFAALVAVGITSLRIPAEATEDEARPRVGVR
jgi:hypothetical protein